MAVLATSLAACGPAPSTAPPSAGSTAPAGSAPITRGSPSPVASPIGGAITEAGLRARLQALAAAEDGSDAYRALGSSGYERAADTVMSELTSAGWTVTEDRFTTPAFADEGGASVQVGGRSFGADDVRPLIFAPSGAADGPVVAIDWDPGATGPGTKGCRASDYGELPAHAIVLVRSGPCFRRDEVLAAQAAGAEGFVAVLPGARSGGVLRPTLIQPDGLEIPVASVSWDAASALAAAAAAGGSARLETHTRTWLAETRSIIADLPGDRPDAVVMLGAHLDSVIDGPGINDDGSGIAALLEIARALGGARHPATIRLAFWAAEEEGLKGSTEYVVGLDEASREAIVAYLNLDMIGSPNGFVGVYDEVAAPAGSSAVREQLEAALRDQGATPVGVDVGGASDHLRFQRAGIPTGGVYSGAVEPLTAAQAATAGGHAGDPGDACYHLACDTLSNVDLRLARLLAAGVLDATVRLADEPDLVAPGS